MNEWVHVGLNILAIIGCVWLMTFIGIMGMELVYRRIIRREDEWRAL